MKKSSATFRSKQREMGSESWFKPVFNTGTKTVIFFFLLRFLKVRLNIFEGEKNPRLYIFVLKPEIRPQEKLFSRHFLLKHNQKVLEVSTETSSWSKFSERVPHPLLAETLISGHLSDILLNSQSHYLHFSVSEGYCSTFITIALVFHCTYKFGNKNSTQG